MYERKRGALMKQSKTVLKELTAAYRAVLRHGILCNAIALGLMAVATPAMAGDPTTGDAWVFGDVSFTGQHVAASEAAFGGRRLADSTVAGKYHNVFPKYNMVGQSFALSNSDAYFGPINLTLGTLEDGADFAFNWQAPDADVNADMDIAAAAQIGWDESVDSIVGKLTTAMTEVFTPLYDITTEAGQTALANAVSAGVNGAAGAVYKMSRTDTDTTNDGVLALDNVDAVVDGATITAKTISVSNGSKLTFVKQDTALLNTANRFYTNAEDIDSDGVTTLNAEGIFNPQYNVYEHGIEIRGSTLEVKPGAKLSINPTTPNGVAEINYVTSDYGALTVNGGGSIYSAGDKLSFTGNKTTSHGAGLYFKDQAYGHGEEHGSSDKVLLESRQIVFSGNEVLSTATSGSGAAIFVSGGEVSILGTQNTLWNNRMNATVAEDRLYKTGGGAIANQSYEIQGSTAENQNPIDANMVIGKASSTNWILNNSSKTNGGAIMNRAVDYDGDATLTINGTTRLESNHADIHGGAIYNIARNGRTATINMTNGTYSFDGNTAGANGGAIYNEGTLSLSNATFGNVSANTAKNGGAIYNSGIMNIANSEFVDNNATVTGGAVFSTGKLTVTDSLFDGNTADYGAAIRTVVNAPSTLTISGTTFRNNHANENGAVGIFDKSAESSITNSHFINNYTTFNDADAFAAMSVPNQNQMEGAGALSLGSESLVTISGTEFKNNYTTLGGGAISTRTTAQNNVGEKLDITNSTFIGNKAGVIYDATSDSVSASNFAKIRGFGGAIYANVWNNKKGEGFATISDSTFTKNEAYNGGAIYNDAADGKVGNIKLTNSSFTSNIASENGGAIYNSGELTLAGINKFTGNKAGDKSNDIHNLGTLTIASGTTTIDGGVTGDGALTIDNGATLNIGTASVAQNTITLNGNMLATLREGDAQITAGTFTGNGTLKLTMAQAGTYKVFGDKSFANIAWDESGLTTSSPIYNLTWNGGDVTATRKTAAQVAEDNNLTEESGSFVSNLTDSSSDKLKELSVALQEKLAAGDTESVEHATRAVHPEKESVVQSVSTSVQNTVVNLASSRMVMPTAGRAGGDVKLTSGGMWVQGLYNKSKHADAFSGYTRGIAAGLDGTLNKVWTIGAGYSFAHSNIGGTARDIEIDSNTFFLYGQYKPSNWYLNAVANYTWSDYSENGTILDNMLISADYNVDSFGGNIATGYDFDNGITPELGLRYIHVSADDYTNSYGVKTHLDDSDYMTGILGARYTFNIVANKYTTFMPQLHAAAKYDLLSDKNVATVTMPGINSYVMDNERLNRFGGEFGIGLGVKYGNLDMSLNYDIDVRKDYTSQTGMLKFRANF